MWRQEYQPPFSILLLKILMTKRQLKQKAEELHELIKDEWSKFVGGYTRDDGPEIIVYKKNHYYVEELRLYEQCSLCMLEIIRRYLPGETQYVDNSVTIKIRWFDWHDDLEYNCNFFANMTNKDVADKTKILLQAAYQLADTSYTNKECGYEKI